MDDKKPPHTPEEALAHIQQAVREGKIEYTSHAEDRIDRRLSRPRPPLKCGICGQGLVRDERHDAYYCPDHGWTEPVCSDPECEFCQGRPPTPLGNIQ
jgi:hypothetical protein